MYNIKYVRRVLENFLEGTEEKGEQTYLDIHLPRYVNTLNQIPEQSGNKIALDVGTNYGHLSFLLKELFGYHVVAIDVAMPDYVKERLIKHGIEVKFGVFQQDAALQEPPRGYSGYGYGYRVRLVDLKSNESFRDNSFDLVLFTEVLEHLFLPPQEIFQEIHRILKNDGIMICTTPNISRIDNRLRLLLGRNPQLFMRSLEYGTSDSRGHFREYSAEELQMLVERLFMIKKVRFVDNVGKFGLVKKHLKFKVIYYPYKFFCALRPSFKDTLAIIGIKKRT